MSPVYWGQGFPDNLNLPASLRIRADIGPEGELVDITDWVDRRRFAMERTNTPGASTATIVFLAEVGNQYDIRDTNTVYIDTTDPADYPEAWPTGWPNTGAYLRLFMGTTVKPDSTQLTPDVREITLQCVDNGWWEKYPPMQAGLPWPPSGTPFVDTVFLDAISAGLDRTVVPYRMRNIYAGKRLYVADPDGTHIERITVKSVNYTGQLLIEQQILAAGTHTITGVDTTGLEVGQPYHVYNTSDGTHWETIYPTAVTGGVSGSPVSGASAAFGVATHLMWNSQAGGLTEIDRLHEDGVAIVRFDFAWRAAEPSSGGYDSAYLAKLTAYLGRLDSYGMDAIITVIECPSWANGSSDIWRPPTSNTSFSSFMAYMASHYPGRKWEIWNEPSFFGNGTSTGFFHPFGAPFPAYSGTYSVNETTTANAYADMCLAAYSAMKAADATCTVLGGSLHINYPAWLNKVYAHLSGSRAWDAVSIHPYCGSNPPSDTGTSNSSFLLGLTDTRAAMDAAGQSALPIYITEWTYRVPTWVTETARGDYFEAAVGLLASGDYPTIKSLCVYTTSLASPSIDADERLINTSTGVDTPSYTRYLAAAAAAPASSGGGGAGGAGGSFTAAFVNSHKTGPWVLMAGSFVADFEYDHAYFATTSTERIDEFGQLQHIPVASASGISGGMQLTLFNADRTFLETVTVLSVSGSTVDAIVAWPKRVKAGVPWNVVAYPTLTGGLPDNQLLAGEWYQDVDNRLTPMSGLLYTFYDDSQSTVVPAGHSGGVQVCNPSEMDNIFPGRTLLCMNADGTGRERVTVTATATATFTASFALPKSAGWLAFNGPYVDKSAISEIQPSVGLAGAPISQTGSITWAGKTVAQMWSEIESQAVDISTIVDSAASAGSYVVVRPRNMYGFSVGKELFAQNGDGTNSETVRVISIESPTTCMLEGLTSDKDPNWVLWGKVQPRHYWTHNQDSPDHLQPWLPQPHYYDAAVRDKLALRVLSDAEVVDATTGVAFGTYAVRRDGTEHYNAVQVVGRNNSWGRAVDWDAVRGTGGKPRDGRVMEGPVVVRQDLYTNEQCYEFAWSVLSAHNAARETPTVTVYGMISPNLFYDAETVTLYKSGEPGLANGRTVPITRVRLSMDDEGVARYELELGDIVPEGLAHAVAGWVGNSARLLGPPVHSVQVITRDGDVRRGATAYIVDASTATDPGDGEAVRTVTLPPTKGDPTWHAYIVKADPTAKRVYVKAPDNHTIDGASGKLLNVQGHSVHVMSDGANYHTLQYFNNPHDIEGDPLRLTASTVPDGETAPPSRLDIEYLVGGGSSVSGGTRDLIRLHPAFGWANAGGAQPDVDVWLGELDAGLGLQSEGAFIRERLLTYPGPMLSGTAAMPRAVTVPFVTGSASISGTLPTAVGNAGLSYFVSKIDAGSGSLTLVPAGSELIDGEGGYTLASKGGVLIWSNGANWYTLLGGVGPAVSGGGGARMVTVHLRDEDASTTGDKPANNDRTPIAGNLTDVVVLVPTNVAGTSTLNVKRVAAADFPDISGAVTLNPAPFGISGATRYDVPSLSGWDTSVGLHEWIFLEVVTADAALTELEVSMEVTPV